YVWPDCGLLGLRIVWAVFMLFCALVMAGILLRYFNPIPSFVAAGISLFFVAGGAIKILAYNQMPVLWLLISVWLWLIARESAGRRQILFAAVAGISALLATLCRISLLPVILLPLVSMAYDSLCRFKSHEVIKTATSFIAAYSIGLGCLISALYITGLADHFYPSFSAATNISGHSLTDMFSHLIYSSVFLLLPSMLLLIIILVINYQTVATAFQRNKIICIGILAALAVLLLIAMFPGRETVYQVLIWLRGYIKGFFIHALDREIVRNSYILVALAFAIVFAAVIRHIFFAIAKGQDEHEQAKYNLCIFALFVPALMILGTANYPSPGSVKAISWLPISAAFCLSWSWIDTRTFKPGKGSTWLIRTIFVIVALFYVYSGIAAACFPYRDDYIGRLNSRAISVKLHGIRTTAERALILDRLVAAIEHNSAPGDRILAYENLPMLYFLTDHLPSTNTTWISDFLPASIKSSILADMIRRERLPALVVRAQYSTHDLLWPVVQKPLNLDDADPIDAFIRQHYQVTDAIDGIQIMAPID
ncbi:MAG: hypothetical protein WC541_02850, partial [Dehalococcoidia bacterium]